MIFYLVHIIILMLQLVLGHPISPSNNQDIAITGLVPRGCFSIGAVPGRPPILDTQLPLAIHIPNQPPFIDEITFQNAVGSATIQFINFRSNNQGNPQMFGNVYIRNRSTYTRSVQVYGLRNGVECPEPELEVLSGSVSAISWPIFPGYSYFFRLLN